MDPSYLPQKYTLPETNKQFAQKEMRRHPKGKDRLLFQPSFFLRVVKLRGSFFRQTINFFVPKKRMILQVDPGTLLFSLFPKKDFGSPSTRIFRPISSHFADCRWGRTAGDFPKHHLWGFLHQVCGKSRSLQTISIKVTLHCRQGGGQGLRTESSVDQMVQWPNKTLLRNAGNGGNSTTQFQREYTISTWNPKQPFINWLFQLDDSQSLYTKWLFHQTSIYKWLFGAGVPDIYNMPF